MGLFGRSKPRGLVSAGNIDLHKRPVVKNPDGTISTVRSMSFGTDQGEVLIPTVSDDGRLLSDEEAMRIYDQTGNHLGIFDTPDHATTYAQSLHNDQAREYGGGRMPLFGKGGRFTDKAMILGAGLKDVGGALGGRQTGYLDQYAAQQQAEQRKAQQQQAYGKLMGQMFPQQPAPGQTPGMAAAEGQAGKQSLRDIMPELLQAQAAGVDIGPIVGLYKESQPDPVEYDFINMGAGGVGRGNRQNGEYVQVHTPPAAAPDPVKLQIVQRDDGIYSFNPVTGEIKKISNSRKVFAPPRPSSAAPVVAPPVGFILD